MFFALLYKYYLSLVCFEENLRHKPAGQDKCLLKKGQLVLKSLFHEG